MRLNALIVTTMTHRQALAAFSAVESEGVYIVQATQPEKMRDAGDRQIDVALIDGVSLGSRKTAEAIAWFEAQGTPVLLAPRRSGGAYGEDAERVVGEMALFREKVRELREPKRVPPPPVMPLPPPKVSVDRPAGETTCPPELEWPERRPSVAIVPVPFYGDTLDAVKREDGIWVGVKRACENVGLDPEGQRQRLQKAAWATACVMKAVGADGKNRDMFMLRSDRLAMWLATIEASRVRDDIRPKLERYQNEAADVLAAYFTPAAAHAAGVDVEAIGAALMQTGRQLREHQAKIAQLTADNATLAAKQESERAALESAILEERKAREAIVKSLPDMVRNAVPAPRQPVVQLSLPGQKTLTPRHKNSIRKLVRTYAEEYAHRHSSDPVSFEAEVGRFFQNIWTKSYSMFELRINSAPDTTYDLWVSTIVPTAAKETREQLEFLWSIGRQTGASYREKAISKMARRGQVFVEAAEG